MKTNYLFVNSTGGDKIKNESQRRSHVMQHRSNHDAFKLSTDQIPTNHQDPASAGKRLRFRLGRCEADELRSLRTSRKSAKVSALNKSKALFTDSKPLEFASSDTQAQRSYAAGSAAFRAVPPSNCPTALVGVSRLDPFDSLPLKLHRWDETLLYHYFHESRYPWCPVNAQSPWRSFALSDELVLHATIYAWSRGFAEVVDEQFVALWQDDNPNILKHKLSMISLVNLRLRNPHEVIKDETLAAVVIMTHTELVSGSQWIASKHMNGLKSILDIRGGLNTLVSPTQTLLQRFIMWIDIVYSELYNTPPMFLSACVGDQTLPNPDQHLWPASKLPLLAEQFKAAQIPSYRIVSLLQKVLHLCSEEQQRYLGDLSEYELMQRADRFRPVERDLLDVVLSEDLPGNSRLSNILRTIIAVSTLMFVHYFLHGSPPKHCQYQALGGRLRSLLTEISDDLQELAFNRSLLFWILSVGAVTTSKTAHQIWFIRKLRQITSSQSIGWLELRSLLMNFLWTGSNDEARYHEMWHLVENEHNSR